MEILKVENLTKSYGKGEAKVDAIKNINLSVSIPVLVNLLMKDQSYLSIFDIRKKRQKIATFNNFILLL